MIWLRSILYWLLLIIITPLFTLLAIVILPLPAVTRNQIIRWWSVILLKWLHLTCGLKFRVEGAENIPEGPMMIMCKHQSAWETMALQLIFPPQVWVMKRELLKMPFFGWALATTSPIAIDRGQRAAAQRQLMEQGKDRLAKGLWIVIFPEGTRIKPGERGQYKQGGARLALDLNVPIVPVAMNSGEFWPKNSFLKWPGEITVRVGAPIASEGKKSLELIKEVENWIEGQMDEISGRGPCFEQKKA
ncbi:lysophospholipid acyltransferase family protein [Deefgea salmonis]|uniref:1-acyl-sn-glycerol-3-phosphate acyltransferase n=1 Tax=Deefgea salmonis TaxID=2875502 RepID=A0ABS8BNU9_9NEIS|nr:lysophospholipid acyltransferase family protein [Deefgea salmonis]MCB5197413.1 1-acyl-sn-glycerol-3-phosphate acyltransferase [Deefgea salmonis]